VRGLTRLAGGGQRDHEAPRGGSRALGGPAVQRFAVTCRITAVHVVADLPLRFLHSETILSAVKLEQFRTMTTDRLLDSLRPGESAALKARADGTVLDGHHRLVVLRERGVNIDALPRELLPTESES
jgi:hypothetical protein